jgi:hypothetical protein
VLLAEPTLYVYGGNSGGAYCYASFERFWLLFERLQEFVELNDARLYTAADLHDAVSSLFPYATLLYRSSQPDSRVYAAAALVLRFLGRYCVQPLSGYEGAETSTTFDEGHLPRGPVYSNGSVWIAWQDLAARVGLHLLDQGKAHGNLIATFPADSCVSAESTQLSLIYGGEERFSFQIHRAGEPSWPTGFIDPVVMGRMRNRPGSNPVKLAYEDSGHQPSPKMKRVLGRTVNDAADIVLRMNTERNAHAADTCKLELAAAPAQIRFRISDGDMTYHGFFTTTATDVDEQRASLVYLSRFYRSHCQRESFRLTED